MPQFPSRPEGEVVPGPTSSLTVTRGVRVEAHPVYLNEQTDAEGHNHVFGYRIQITNQSDQSVQVLGRGIQHVIVVAYELPVLRG